MQQRSRRHKKCHAELRAKNEHLGNELSWAVERYRAFERQLRERETRVSEVLTECELLRAQLDAARDAAKTASTQSEQFRTLVKRMVAIHHDEYDALVDADPSAANSRHEEAEEAWVRDALDALASS